MISILLSNLFATRAAPAAFFCAVRGLDGILDTIIQ